MIIAGIYHVTSPSGKIYVGQSNDINGRFMTYFKMKKNRIGSALYASFVKHGVENHRFKIIAILHPKTTRHQLDHFEKLYIATEKRIGAKMLNLTDGGCGSLGYKHTPKTIERLRELGTGTNSGMSKRIVQYDADGNFIKEFDTITSAGRALNISPASISASCRKIIRMSAGYVWRYKEDSFSLPNSRKYRPVIQLSLDGTFIKEYSSILEAAITISGKNTGNIRTVCIGKAKTAYGFKWKYKYSSND